MIWEIWLSSKPMTTVMPMALSSTPRQRPGSVSSAATTAPIPAEIAKRIAKPGSISCPKVSVSPIGLVKLAKTKRRSTFASITTSAASITPTNKPPRIAVIRIALPPRIRDPAASEPALIMMINVTMLSDTP